jgi:hypothetical protein
VSNKPNLKDKIKKPNATQTFFNSYDTNVAVDDKDKDNTVIDSKNDVVWDNGDKNNIKNSNETYVKDVVNDDNVVNDDDDDYLRSLASGTKMKKKKKKKVFTSFYMDPDLAVEVDNIASRGEKGDKSKLINKAIRSLLEEYGVIDKRY